MKHLTTLLLTLLVLGGCTKEVHIDKTVERYGKLYEVNSDVPFTGDVVNFHRINGQLFVRIPYKNGLRHGVTNFFKENGAISRIENHVNGQQHGTQTLYGLDGKVLVIDEYEYGTLVNQTRPGAYEFTPLIENE